MRLTRYVRACFLLAIVTIFAPAAAFARHGGPHDYNGIAIASLMHGQVLPMYENYPAVMALAARVTSNSAYAGSPAAADIRELMTFANSEYNWALHGIVPGSFDNDMVPWHFPTHAYLATGREIMVRLNTLDGLNPEVANLALRVDQAMADNGASLITCRYSGISFNTATPVGPVWAFTTPRLSATGVIALFGLGSLMLAGAVAAYRRRASAIA